jgi:hypothetical protein
LECGSLLPLLRLELARDAVGSKLPTKENGSKLTHSKVMRRGLRCIFSGAKLEAGQKLMRIRKVGEKAYVASNSE